ncbi:MAG: hydrolase [Thalassolituus sp.]
MLDRNRTGLVIVDVQGRLAEMMHESEAMHASLKVLIKGAKVLGMPILWVEQNPDKLGETSPEIAELLAESLKIQKYTFSGCGETVFVRAVEETRVHTWVVAGIESHICVYQTVREMIEWGRKVEVVTDCVSSRTATNRELGLQRMAQAGAKMTSVEMCLFELLRDCRAPEFKEILQLVK